MRFPKKWFESFALLTRAVRSSTSISLSALFACAAMFAQESPPPAADKPSKTAAANKAEDKATDSKEIATQQSQTAPEPSSAQLQPKQDESFVASPNRSASAVHAASEDSTSAAAKDAAQNPLARTISIPFQNNTFFNVGPYGRAENGLLIEPVIPFKLTDSWNVITRSIIPVIYAPRVSPSEGSNFGLGNLNPQFYFSPVRAGSIIWGAGPQLWLPTATDRTLGVNKFGGGPAVVVLTKQGHWLVGALANNVWAGRSGSHINQMTLNPFIYYNMSRGWYLVSSEVMTANWVASSRDRWTVPAGGGFGRVFKIGAQALNARTQFWKDVKTPRGGPDWTFQSQIQLVFPRK